MCPPFPFPTIPHRHQLLALFFFHLCALPFCFPADLPSKPIVPAVMAEAGRTLMAQNFEPSMASAADGASKWPFGRALNGLMNDKIDGTIRQLGEKAIGKMRELKMMLPQKFQALMDAAIKIFGEKGTNEKERWDKLVKSVESTNLSGDEKREFYEKIASSTQQLH